MLEYIFFHDEPRKQFIQYLLKQDIPYVEQDDSMGMVVAVPENLGEVIEDAIESHYDKLMENAEELLIDEGEAAEKDVAAITITLDDGKTIYASVSPNVINRVLGVITTQELNDLVNSIVTSVLDPDERPICTR
ncbi:MAG: hypothetical protein U9N50_14440 [Pseudomonadota bacterium]|nr:hypothetical protein [Pseudomonadota bacterium]